jgi:hypothetical protein
MIVRVLFVFGCTVLNGMRRDPGDYLLGGMSRDFRGGVPVSATGSSVPMPRPALSKPEPVLAAA